MSLERRPFDKNLGDCFLLHLHPDHDGIVENLLMTFLPILCVSSWKETGTILMTDKLITQLRYLT